MRDKIPDNVFLDNRMRAQMDEIIAFRDMLIEKHKAVFSDESMFINLSFQSFPEQEIELPDSLPFGHTYSTHLPKEISDEFELFLFGRFGKK